jgi:endonuclease/exonuclease/phosphatase (EEP) superfamily protein YafD
MEDRLNKLSSFDTDYIIIGGDFNTFPLSKSTRKMTKIFNDALWPTACYFTGTYTELDYPFRPRIDFIFHSPAIRRYRADVIKKGPSDHYPVKAIFGIEG